eukprot:TRINITY_DN6807_c0_g2_i5.p3 TRINITY_DN6807_c0_g2~~TRINITY_DN6807_c0_g2_i5.p3  ORF type:complete len:122 (-),score=9.31 TRINITY_DN6807_c0_g2_i5:430-795(-)
MDDKTLLEELVNYQHENNLTQSELADKLGVSRESVYRWICGRAKLRPTNRRIIVDLLNKENETPEICNVGKCSLRNSGRLDNITDEMLKYWQSLDQGKRIDVLSYMHKIMSNEEQLKHKVG